ncbi:hypothetical protein [Haematobacter genomosp. 1]|uniref:Uncharacterized protein n=1 Tax=Haematobacter genomosp. 1 TaxID=366618 RepID=A0A212ADN2_9RHOB|nr:hypothetical protein [Haematobacter genomosp. 1]OWJ79330.1 hypothetical protein CDV49_05435 [Haematobacter genomosp. 1]
MRHDLAPVAALSPTGELSRDFMWHGTVSMALDQPPSIRRLNDGLWVLSSDRDHSRTLRRLARKMESASQGMCY